jgi:hypothetical protein
MKTVSTSDIRRDALRSLADLAELARSLPFEDIEAENQIVETDLNRGACPIRS